MTNFERITESPERLARFMGKWFVLPCELCYCWHDKCTAQERSKRCSFEDDFEAFEKWLNRESDTE